MKQWASLAIIVAMISVFIYGRSSGIDATLQEQKDRSTIIQKEINDTKEFIRRRGRTGTSDRLRDGTF